MKLELLDIDEFININKLQEITSPILFERGGVPHPQGLISNEIFGINTQSRRETFAYIELGGYFFHPHIYKVFKRLYRNVIKLISGEYHFRIDEEGRLIRDEENGETGIEWLYDNWEKITWERKGATRNERIDLLTKTPKNVVFMHRYVVIPAFYRDITTSPGGGGSTCELNPLYTRLIRYAAILNERNMFDFSFYSTCANIQDTLVDIYDYFKTKLERKSGLLRKYLMGKNVDYAVRSVISGPTFHGNRPEDMMVDFDHVAVPLSQCCVMVYPFIVKYVKDFFEREIISSKYSKYSKSEQKTVEIKDPESFYNDAYVEKHIKEFIFDPTSRFDPIEIPLVNKDISYLSFRGKLHTDLNNKIDVPVIANRYMTWTDLLFMAASDATKDKHILITRYPLLDAFGIYTCKIRVNSTADTVPMVINGELYRWYPVVDPKIPKNKISALFVDTIQMSNAYLKGLDGDYDGDQITAKIVWTQESNEECDRMMNSKSFILNVNGESMRTASIEPCQTLYDLTKDPD